MAPVFSCLPTEPLAGPPGGGFARFCQRLSLATFFFPSCVLFIFVAHFPVETDDPLRHFCLNPRGEFKNPSLKAVAGLVIGIMIAHECDPDIAKNLVYRSVAGVDLLPVMGPHDWSSKKAAYIAPNDYDTAMSQMAEASSEMLEELLSTFRPGHKKVSSSYHNRM